MEPFIDYYKVLGLEPDASSEHIRKAFRQYAKEYHPDVNKSEEARTRFIDISNAHAVLSDPVRKRAFDLARVSRSLQASDHNSIIPTYAAEQPEAQEYSEALQSDREAVDYAWFGSAMATRMQSIQDMLNEFEEARSWQYSKGIPRWRVLIYRGLQVALMAFLLGILVPVGGFKLYLSIFQPTPAFTDMQPTTTGVGVAFLAHLYGQQGDIRARFYDDGQLLDIQSTSVSTFSPFENPVVRMTSDAYKPYMIGTNGTIKLYWCLNYDCSKEQLLQSLNFTVSDVTHLH